MGWQADEGHERGMRPAGMPGLPVPDPSTGDPGLHGFAKGGDWDTCPPSAALAIALESASGPEWRCPEATKDELAGLLRQWQALESWAAAGKLGVLRALIRDEDQPLPGGGHHGDLPDGWTRSLTHDVALALSMPAVSAENLMWLAWDLAARLPGTGDLLATGQLTYAKAKAVNEALQPLSEQDAAAAESIILPDLPGKTYGQAERLALQAAITVDPESAARRREDAEQRKSRVEMFREQSGAAALSGRDLPTDQALTAHASLCARAQEYKDSGAFPDDTRMDQYRAAAYLDLLNDIPAEVRIASGQIIPVIRTNQPDATGRSDDGGQITPDARRAWSEGDDPDDGHGPDGQGPDGRGPDGRGPDGRGPDGQGPDGRGPDGRGPDGRGPDGQGPGGRGPGGRGPDGQGPDGHGPDGQSPDGHGPDGHGPRGEGPDGRGPGGQGPRGSGPNDKEPNGNGGASPNAASPRLADLVLPLSTLLGLADRPGEGHALGPLDPDLCRALAMSAAASPHTTLCVTVTDEHGIAIGHGCARLPTKETAGPAGTGTLAEPAGAAPPLPSRVNLTITATRLAQLNRPGRPGRQSGQPTQAKRSPGQPGHPPWLLTNTSDHGPPGGHGTWTLTLPDDSQRTVRLEPMPTFGCDHRHESHAYQPNDTLRHLVQVRDYTCTFPSCSRHARESDFEHAVPYDKGGRTCACNAGARSRQCHQVKQSAGWTVTQPRPGWHQWTTPSGRAYLREPKRYPI
jgi:Domain of unknown function (DUF222)